MTGTHTPRRLDRLALLSLALALLAGCTPAPGASPSSAPEAPGPEGRPVGAMVRGVVTRAAGTVAGTAVTVSAARAVNGGQCSGPALATREAVTGADGRYEVTITAGTAPFVGCVQADAALPGRPSVRASVGGVRFVTLYPGERPDTARLDIRLPD